MYLRNMAIDVIRHIYYNRCIKALRYEDRNGYKTGSDGGRYMRKPKIYLETTIFNYYIFSYNFHHINRNKTKKMTSVINIREGYKPITITIASEVVEHGVHE